MITALEWVLAPVLLALAASSAWWTRPGRRRGGQQAPAAIWACAAVIVLAVAGALPLVPAAVLAAVLAASAAVIAFLRHETPGDVLGSMSESPGLALRLLRKIAGGSGEPAAADAGPSAPEAAVAEAVSTRNIPNVMDDPALGPAPEPGELTAGGIPAPAPYAALAEFIAGFEPEDDMALRMFMESSAAGSVMVADAWHHFADTCLNSVGLDPAFVAGILEAGDSAGGHGTLLAQVHKRFGVIYAAVKEWVGAHGPLPHKARDFLTGE